MSDARQTPVRQHASRWRIAIWLAVMAVAAWVVSTSRFSTDMSVFLPSEPTARQQILVDQIKDGTLSRLVLIGIEGGNAEQRANASRQLAQWLRTNAAFDGAVNADASSREKDFAWLMAHRYVLSDQITPERFSSAGLLNAINAGANALATPEGLALKLIRSLEDGLDTIDAGWLARIESAQQSNPRDARLQYLAGMACLKRQLWGKAQQLLAQASTHLHESPLRASAWRHLAELAEQRGDADAAAQAWKAAALQH